MKIIFLDVDGVLTHSEYENDSFADIDETKVELLKEIIDKTSAKIVLTSNWKDKCIIGGKEHRLKEYHILTQVLKHYGIEMYDETKEEKLKLTVSPELLRRLPREELKKVRINPYTTRTGEIYKWLNNNENIESFVIIDDEEFEYENFGYQDNFIKTDYYNGGLLKEHVEEAINMLNNPKVKKR